jgi:ATP/maltotriose-dependent transcriptional regulator MalT
MMPTPIRSQFATQPIFASELLDDHELLTAREREILGLIGNALSNKAFQAVTTGTSKVEGRQEH